MIETGIRTGCEVRFGVDFGTTTTKVAYADDETGTCRLLALPPLSRVVPEAGTGEEVPVIPSLVHFTSGGTPLVGAEALEEDEDRSGSTATCLKHYLFTNSPVQLPAGGGTQINTREAGRVFFGRVLALAITRCGCRPTQLVFTLPLNAPPHFKDWIAGVATSAGIRNFHLLDEYAATILGMGVALVPDRPVLVVAFGGVSVDVALVLPEDAGTGTDSSRCRVVGSAQGDTGGAEIDAWLYDDVVSRHCPGTTAGRANRGRSALLRECERVKERLSMSGAVDMTVPDAGSGAAICARITRDLFEQILQDHGLFAVLNRTIDRALSAAQMRGYAEGDVRTVILSGGCAAIPAVQEAVRRRFPCHTVVCDRPAWAAARGAALYTPGSLARDTVRNDYALRYWDPVTLRHGYRLLVRSGTPYPSAGQVARLVISAAYDGQTHLGIPLYEIRNGDDRAPCQTLELVAATGGGLRCADARGDSSDQHPPVWVNERAPTFLVASPPAKKGEPRFEVTFTIDGTKQLSVTARDVQTGRLIKDASPLFRLT